MCQSPLHRLRIRKFYLFGALSRPTHALETIQRFLLSEVFLPLSKTAAAEPRSRFVANEVVIDVWVMAKLMPAEVTPVAEDNLVLLRAKASGTHFAQCLLGCPFAIVLPFLGACGRRGIVRGGFLDLTAGLGHSGCNLIFRRILYFATWEVAQA